MRLVELVGWFFVAILVLTFISYGPVAALNLANHWLSNIQTWWRLHGSHWAKS